ncbi:HAMP domain-containing histidine kinase [Gemmiger formicilis]|uniref:sensor histidine kinase n=1 Tax=Gemmiger formicilis TaxID=745368 RepID=UPI00195629A4|nr:HAMP domain-containing sensor histidine kinase [Gemmiger formicilis]MBM6916464.1 HAMP domain-containing histidine kinase [Gemmiger formicilis]
MKTRLGERIGVRALAFFLLAVSFAIGGLSLFGTLWCENCNWYANRQAESYFETEAFYGEIERDTTTIAQIAGAEGEPDWAESIYSPQNSNLTYELWEVSGKDPMGEGTLLSATYTASTDTISGSATIPRQSFYYDEGAEDVWYRVDWTVDCTLPVGDSYYYEYLLFVNLYDERYFLPAVAAASLAFSLGLLIFLLWNAGRAPGGQRNAGPAGFLPLEAYLLLTVGGGALCLALMSNGAQNILGTVLWLLGLWGGFLFFTDALMGICARARAGVLFRHSLSGAVLRWTWRLVRGFFRWLRDSFAALPLVWGAMMGGVCVLLGETVLTLIAFDSYELFFWLLWFGAQVLLLAVLCRFFAGLHQLRLVSRKMAQGDLSVRVPAKKLWGPLREQGEDLNRISEGMSAAVDERLRSERFKADLITNVSHDLKTPLTSIINYVDLLQKQPLEPQAAEYAAVIARQGQRLKKLTEDLVEASKASSGSLPVNAEPTDLAELLTQAVGEYAPRLEKSNLEPVLQLPGEPVWSMLDGRLTWRVVDNLLSNACKYSQPGTRVYVEAEQREGRAWLRVKNISRQQLNIPADELMERFVRGDSSRTTEGSGLGLNIARSLAELQNGEFGLAIDGDLFKAWASFPLSAPPVREEPPADVPNLTQASVSVPAQLPLPT